MTPPPEITQRILALKRMQNPATGRPYNYREIGKLLGSTGQNIYYYTKHLQGVCPTCLRKLEKDTLNAKSNPTTQPKT